MGCNIAKRGERQEKSVFHAPFGAVQATAPPQAARYPETMMALVNR
jgi:hypothetical protein